MPVERQNSDGSYSGIEERTGQELWRAGGLTGAAGSNIASYGAGNSLTFNISSNTSSADSAGGLLAWQNNLGYDILVTAHQLDVLTASTNTCSASFGHTTQSTISASNMISAQSIHTAGQFNGGALSVKVPSLDWITGSVSSGTSSGVSARAYFDFKPAGAAGAT